MLDARYLGSRLLITGVVARVLVWWWVRTPLANAVAGGWAMFVALIGAALLTAAHLQRRTLRPTPVPVPVRVDAPIVPLRPRVDAGHRRGA